MKRIVTLSLLAALASPLVAQQHPLRALNIEFGIKDHEARSWNGSLSIDKGEIAGLRGHQFKEGESIGPNNSPEVALQKISGVNRRQILQRMFNVRRPLPGS